MKIEFISNGIKLIPESKKDYSDLENFSPLGLLVKLTPENTVEREQLINLRLNLDAISYKYDINFNITEVLITKKIEELTYGSYEESYKDWEDTYREQKQYWEEWKKYFNAWRESGFPLPPLY